MITHEYEPTSEDWKAYEDWLRENEEQDARHEAHVPDRIEEREHD